LKGQTEPPAWDRGVKITLCAPLGIAQVGLVDLRNETMSIHLDPSPKGCKKFLIPARDETISSVA